MALSTLRFKRERLFTRPGLPFCAPSQQGRNLWRTYVILPSDD